MRRVEEMAATRNAGAIAILKNGQVAGKIIIAYPKNGDGTVHVNLWDWSSRKGTPPVQYGKSDGFGCDKVSEAMCGMTFAGMKLSNHPNNYEACLRLMGFELFRIL